ncbi:MAG: hypothetical protein EA350_01890 [Gemmatimonadales bacterium]|nr:MAG: hypothetical protein EA350_01890 [Gemmatimonadales bacterium]
MLAIYVFLLIVGAGLAALSLAGDVLGGGADMDLGGGADLGGGLDVDAAGMDLDGSSMWKAFSVMGLVYGAFGAGATGTILHLLWGGEQVGLTALLALGAGVISGGVASLMLNYLKGSGSGDVASERSFEGLPATVILPLRETGAGKIRVRRGSRDHVLRALPYGTPSPDAGPQEAWRQVVVVEVRSGVAYVTPGGPELERLKP